MKSSSSVNLNPSFPDKKPKLKQHDGFPSNFPENENTVRPRLTDWWSAVQNEFHGNFPSCKASKASYIVSLKIVEEKALGTRLIFFCPNNGLRLGLLPFFFFLLGLLPSSFLLILNLKMSEFFFFYSTICNFVFPFPLFTFEILLFIHVYWQIATSHIMDFFYSVNDK